ncbi:hypothetical protein B0H14DRAFT_3476701 [Mycena olivaceomarginata]|nr:hypothetical protein B0H14DRAFT_3476701 [Mycena olivaceomarginata]
MPGTVAPAWTTSLIIHAVSKRPATKSAHHGLHGISVNTTKKGYKSGKWCAPARRARCSGLLRHTQELLHSPRRALAALRVRYTLRTTPRRFCAPAFPPSALAAPARRAPERPARGSGLLQQTPPLPSSPLPATPPPPRHPAAFALPPGPPSGARRPRRRPALMPTLSRCAMPRALPPPPPFLPAHPTPPTRAKTCTRTGQEDARGSPNAEPPRCRPPLPTVKWAGDAPPPCAFSPMAGIEARRAGRVGKVARMAHAS